MFTIPNLPANAALVPDSELSTFLPKSGNRGAHRWSVDDKVVIPADTQVYSIDRGTDGNSKLVAYIGAEVNGRPMLLPFSAFRAFPRDDMDFVQQSHSEVMKALLNGDDFDRFQYLKGKSLRVSAVEEWETRDWNASPSGTKTDIKYKKAKFAVFVLNA